MVRVVCVVGYPGAGKSVATDVAEELGLETAVMGDQVRERAEQELQPALEAEKLDGALEHLDEAILQKLDLERIRQDATSDDSEDNAPLNPLSRSDLIGTWATVQRARHGDEVVAEWTAEYIETHAESETVLVDGVRSCEERNVFAERFDSVEVVSIEAPFDARLRRLQERDRDGEGDFTEADLQARDEREDTWGVGEIVEEADTIVKNTGSLDEYRAKLKRILST